MTAPKTTELATLDLAILELQRKLPKAKKAGTAQYGSYVTLEDLTDAVFERLTGVGLTYSAVTQIHPSGKPVLHCWLTHAATGQVKEGDWPLPDTTDPQRLGSSITYGRRYQLTALTGVVADKDDDGALAHQLDRDFVAQARKSSDYREVRRIWTTARAGGATADELAEIEKLGAQLKPDEEKTDDGAGKTDG